MADTEQETATTEKAEIVNSLEAVESIVNNYARKQASKHGIREDIFTIHLTRKLTRGDMSVVPGPHIEVYMLWPAVQPIINSKLDSLWRLIKTKAVYTPLAVATHAFFTKEAGEGKKWVREKLGSDAADTIGALVGKHRLQTIITTVIEVKDTITGSSVMASTQKIGDYRDAPVAMWSALSQVVYDKGGDDDTCDDAPPTTSETPLLDEVIATVEQQL